MKYWKGKWIIIVAILHIFLSLKLFGTQFQEIMAQGIFGAANTVDTKLATWFFLSGILLIAIGQFFISTEKANAKVPISVAVTLLIFTLLGAALIPISGFWLVFPPIIAVFFDKKPR